MNELGFSTFELFYSIDISSKDFRNMLLFVVSMAYNKVTVTKRDTKIRFITKDKSYEKVLAVFKNNNINHVIIREINKK